MLANSTSATSNVLIPMWWGGFSELNKYANMLHNAVLIPMWWGGFSEDETCKPYPYRQSLNPHVVGRFFRAAILKLCTSRLMSLNPHVVGRFFRVHQILWLNMSPGLNPHVVGRFFRALKELDVSSLV